MYPILILSLRYNFLLKPSFKILYGTTENSPATFQTLKEDEPLKRINAVGQVVEHLEVNK